ncbi:hypothetical protein PIIN_04844 [Serendipita indica DSM 11827]|uniref:Uncharacterized protein n=1 Tax=Serendipita indica (strain DSM 11827) TaxID=1109443 RepID=G4THW0_SERID|nr:hypothetical protein PIIN_04844 [Serendipita indica DSM 11827]
MLSEWTSSSSANAFASPPSGGALPYPSYTPYPSRTPSRNTQSSPSNSQSSSNGGRSVTFSTKGSNSGSGWKSLINSKTPRRSQTAPWKTPPVQQAIAAPPHALQRHPAQKQVQFQKQGMAYYGYYQQNAPGWATSNYDLPPPPMPAYNPLPTWGGYDYYLAHSGDTERGFFDSLWNRFKSAVGVTVQGYSRQHAKQIYRQVYGGLRDPLECTPDELGAAAGYEAIRIWEFQHNSMNLPLNPDLEREREALAGLAIGEANRLWSRANPYRSRRGRHQTAEVALATAERIFTFQYDPAGGVAPYLSPEQQYANRGLVNTPLVGGGYAEPFYERGRSVGFTPSSSFGRRSRSRRGSLSYGMADAGYAGPPVSSIPIGTGGIGGGYTNVNGYNIAPGPVMYPGEMPPSPRGYGRAPLIVPQPDVYPVDDYAQPMGAPSSYGTGYGPAVPVGPPGSYGGGAVYPAGSYVAEPMMGAPSYRRQRSYSTGYGPAGY